MTDERPDDEILGRALSRAIETIDVNQTPFERSRIASAPPGRSVFGVWQIAGGVIAIALAIAIGSWFARPTESQPGAAASPSAPAATSTPTTTATPAATIPGDRIWVYFARDGLAPTGGFVTGVFDNRGPESRILSRLGALRYAKNGQPSGATNPFAEPTPTQSGRGTFGMSISLIQGDLATVEFEISSGWGVHGSAQSLALVQQLVYTITEEPGINRALIKEKGKPNAVIDQLVVDKPLTREDVFGYSFAATLGASGAIADGGNTAASYQVAITASVDTLAPGLARVVLTFKSPNGADVADRPGFTASLDQSDRGASPNDAKYLLNVQLQAARITWMTADTVIDQTPLRFVRVSGSTLGIGLDDTRPWRLFTLSNPARIVIDIGGAPQAVSDRIAVYGPTPGSTIDSRISRMFTLSGAARVFEANVAWRLKEASGKTVANGNFLASLGSSALWGTFDTRITIPTGLMGPVTVELYEASPKDGTEQGLVAVPLVVR